MTLSGQLLMVFLRCILLLVVFNFSKKKCLHKCTISFDLCSCCVVDRDETCAPILYVLRKKGARRTAGVAQRLPPSSKASKNGERFSSSLLKSDSILCLCWLRERIKTLMKTWALSSCFINRLKALKRSETVDISVLLANAKAVTVLF